MSNLAIAKEKVNAHAVDILKLLAVSLGIGLVVGLLSVIPILGLILTIAGELYVTFFTLHGINELVIEEKTKPLTELLKESCTLIKDKCGEILKNYLILFLYMIPAAILLVIITFTGLTSILFSGDMSAIFLIVISLIVAGVYCSYFSFRFLYIYAGILLDDNGGDYGKQVYAEHKMDVLKMCFVLLGLSLIPFIGWIFAFIWNIYYETRIILDVKNSITIVA